MIFRAVPGRVPKCPRSTIEMTPTNIDPPQPAGVGQYPLTTLVPSTIKVYSNRADYQQKTGKAAPDYNPAIPVKRWVDTSVQPGVFAFLSYNTAHLDAAG